MAARILGRIGGTGMRLGKALVTTPAGLTTLGGLGCGHLLMQSYFGTATDFFEYTFETKQPPEKIVDFYSTGRTPGRRGGGGVGSATRSSLVQLERGTAT